MIPNLITASRLAVLVPLAGLLWTSWHHSGWRWSVVLLFSWVALSDWLDGLLARRLDAQTAFGTKFDPAADKIVALVCFVMLAWAGLEGHYFPLPLWLIGLVVGKDVWTVTGYLVIRLMGVSIAVRPSRWGKASTFFQMALVGSILVGPELSWLRLGWLREFLIWPAAAMTVAAMLDYTATAVGRLATVQLAALAGRNNSK